MPDEYIPKKGERVIWRFGGFVEFEAVTVGVHKNNGWLSNARINIWIEDGHMSGKHQVTSSRY